MINKEISRYLTILTLYEQQRWNDFGSVPAITRNVYWQIRYTGPERIGTIVRSIRSGYRGPNLEDQVLMQNLTKSRNIRIIPIESKWNAVSA